MDDKPKILLTGATGFLGTAILSRLHQTFDVIPLGYRSCPKGGLQVDLGAEGEVERLVKEIHPDIILNAAAFREPDYCEENVEGAMNLNAQVPARFAKALPETARMLQISTDYVFDGKTPPYAEEDAVCPVNVYGKAKAEAERSVLSHPGGMVLRIPVLIGAGPGFVQQMIQALTRKVPQEIDDVLIRHPTWIADVADVCSWLISSEKRGMWHASSEQGGTRYELTQRVGKALNVSSDHLVPSKDVIPRKAERPYNTKLLPQKLLQAGGPTCKELEEVIRTLKRHGVISIDGPDAPSS